MFSKTCGRVWLWGADLVEEAATLLDGVVTQALREYAPSVYAKEWGMQGLSAVNTARAWAHRSSLRLLGGFAGGGG